LTSRCLVNDRTGFFRSHRRLPKLHTSTGGNSVGYSWTFTEDGCADSKSSDDLECPTSRMLARTGSKNARNETKRITILELYRYIPHTSPWLGETAKDATDSQPIFVNIYLRVPPWKTKLCPCGITNDYLHILFKFSRLIAHRGSS
jgi:hypothetical protein